MKPIISPAWCGLLLKPDCDVLIVGGGIYGCGIAQAAAASGYAVTLIEKDCIASGTSSQSTKLIHGGLRYLEQANLRLVYEALSERETLLKIAPDLVSREWFYIPIYAQSRRPWWFVACGLALYWLLSGGRSRCRILPRSRWQMTLPGLSVDGLKQVLAYQDGSTNDAALSRALARSAVSFGARIIEGRSLQHATYDGSLWHVHLDVGSELKARMLVNASGGWMAETCSRIKPSPPEQSVRLVQGSHLLLDRPCTAYIYTESSDGRVMFFRPWKGRMLVGTTELELDTMPARPEPTEAEIKAILDTHNRYFPASSCTQADILETFCGVRVLPSGGEGPFAASRETVLLPDQEPSPSYIGVYGGKLTTYRREAEKVMHLIARSLPPPMAADTRRIPFAPADADST
ncbi:MAG: glycerol-3-phosphate dehydrogenase/oxidase [Mariprofundaceae bacterium]|nr:glycerol-3-phosphate dehydrogenase/oxidase [Mariprofundaceae bacterium]